MHFGFFGGHLYEGHNDEFIAHLSFTRRCAIQTNDARATLTFDDVGFKSLAVVVVHNQHLLVGNHAGCVDEIFIDGDAACIIQLRLG